MRMVGHSGKFLLRGDLSCYIISVLWFINSFILLCLIYYFLIFVFVIIPCEFLTLALADGLSIEPKWQQVS